MVDIADGSIIVEAAGTEAEVDALVALLRDVRDQGTGSNRDVVMARGSASIEEALKR